MKKKFTAILLCFFLGGVGAHRFYLKENYAVLMLILGIISVLTAEKIVGISLIFGMTVGVWALIDLIRYCSISEADWQAKYGKSEKDENLQIDEKTNPAVAIQEKDNIKQESKSKCPMCNAEIPDTAKFCPECGYKIDSKTNCPKCGTELQENEKFCPECGFRVR